MKCTLVICTLVASLVVGVAWNCGPRTPQPSRERRSGSPMLAALPTSGARTLEVVPVACASAAPTVEPAAPSGPRFEDLPALGNTPQGALARVKLGIMRKDKAILRDATTGLDDKQIEELGKTDQLLCAELLGCDLQGEEAVLHVGLPGNELHDLRAVRADERWRIEMGALWKEMVFGRNEVTAQCMLKQIVLTEGVWRQTASSGDGVQDYWTEDVAAFHFLKDAGGSPLRFIDIAMAKADRNGLAAWTRDLPAPKAGYWLRAMRVDESGFGYCLGPQGHGTNQTRYGFCAWPAEHGVTGVHTFIVNQEGVVYKKDLGLQAAEGCLAWPSADPTSQGWEAAE